MACGRLTMTELSGPAPGAFVKGKRDGQAGEGGTCANAQDWTLTPGERCMLR